MCSELWCGDAQIARATRFFGGVEGGGAKYVWVHGLELAPCRSSGDQNCVVALRFLENLCTLGLGDTGGSSSLQLDMCVERHGGSF